MEKRIEYMYARQPYHPAYGVRLPSLPTGLLVNPGIGGGVKLYDVLLPFHGEDKYEVKKEDSPITGKNKKCEILLCLIKIIYKRSRFFL